MTFPNDPTPDASTPDSTNSTAHPYEPQPRTDNERPRSTAAQWVTIGLLAALGFGFLGWLLLSSNDDEVTGPQATHSTTTIETTQPHPAEDGVVGLPETEEADAADPVGAEDSAPAESRDALQAAKEYIAAQPLSKANLYNQLRDEDGFSAEAATYAVDTVEADWNALALQVARQMHEDGTPEEELLEALTKGPEHFTRSQAEHALEHL